MTQALPTLSIGLARIRRRLVAAGIAILLPGMASAQDFSGKPIQIVVGAPPGGELDLVARIITPRLGEELKTTLLVQNKPGASGVISSEYVAKSIANGHTLLVCSATTVVVALQTMS